MPNKQIMRIILRTAYRAAPGGCNSRWPEGMERRWTDANCSAELQKYTDTFTVRSKGDVWLLLWNSPALGPNTLSMVLKKAKATYSCYCKILLWDDRTLFHFLIIFRNIKDFTCKFWYSTLKLNLETVTQGRFSEISTNNTPHRTLLKKISKPKISG